MSNKNTQKDEPTAKKPQPTTELEQEAVDLIKYVARRFREMEGMTHYIDTRLKRHREEIMDCLRRHDEEQDQKLKRLTEEITELIKATANELSDGSG